MRYPRVTATEVEVEEEPIPPSTSSRDAIACGKLPPDDGYEPGGIEVELIAQAFLGRPPEIYRTVTLHPGDYAS